MDPKVYVIVLNYYSWEDTIECLESLLKLDYKNFQIIVVDNASKNESLSFLKSWAKGNVCLHLGNNNSLKKYSFPLTSKPLSFEHYCAGKPIEIFSVEGLRKIIFIESTENGGYSAGNNLGMEYALSCKDADYFWILNNDTTLPPESLKELVDASERAKRSEKKIGMMGGKLFYYHNPEIIQNVGSYYLPALAYCKNRVEEKRDSDKQNSVNLKINYLSGASLFVPVHFVLEVGKLSEDYFIYMEEVDWTIRAKQKGWQIEYCPKARIFHKEGISINHGGVYALTGIKSKMSDYYWIRNKILITRKYYPLFLPLVIVSTLLAVLQRIKRRQSGRILILLKAMYHGFTGYKINPERLRNDIKS